VVFSVIPFLMILRKLRPLATYLHGGGQYDRVRHAALGVPWFLDTNILYALVFNWNSPGGLSFFQSLMISVSTGSVTGVRCAVGAFRVVE